MRPGRLAGPGSEMTGSCAPLPEPGPLHLRTGKPAVSLRPGSTGGTSRLAAMRCGTPGKARGAGARTSAWRSPAQEAVAGVVLSWRDGPPGARPGRNGRRSRDGFLGGQAPNAAPRFSLSRAQTARYCATRVWSNDAADGTSSTPPTLLQAYYHRRSCGAPEGCRKGTGVARRRSRGQLQCVQGTTAVHAAHLADGPPFPGSVKPAVAESAPPLMTPYPSPGEGKGWHRRLDALPGGRSGPGSPAAAFFVVVAFTGRRKFAWGSRTTRPW
jgi:hypothetical protein